MTRLGILQSLLVPPLALAAMLAGLPSTPGAEVSSPVLHAGEKPVRSRTVPLVDQLVQRTPHLRSSRPLDLAGAEQVALTWTGGQHAPVAEVRTRAAARWSAWTTVEPLEDGDAAEGNGTAGSDLLWVGRRDQVQVRVRGAVPRGLSVVAIDPGRRDSDTDPASAAGPAPASSARAGVARPAAYRLAATTTSSTYKDTTLDAPPHTTFPTPHVPRPTIYSRHAWGADESLRRNPPEWSVTISQVHLHHTASTNSYTRADVAPMIRGMYRYHVGTLGWNDIGYNFLVDKYGRIWEGRAGGVHTPVRGAHTLGFNHRSVGVAVIGNFEKARPSDALLSSVVKLTAWKLDLYRRSPLATVSRTSEGSDRFPNGTSVRLPVFDGHRDTNETACPGRYLYARLPELRKRAKNYQERY